MIKGMNKYQEALKSLEPILIDYVYTNAKNWESIRLLQELVDKATPMKVKSMMLLVNIYEHNCPLCEEKVDKTDYYCRSCGQALDWNKD